MKIFIGQGVTGENLELIKQELKGVHSVIERTGNSYYDTLRDAPDEIATKPKKARLEYAFKKIDESDTFLAIVRSNNRSEGMLIEVGHALSKDKKLILAVKENVNTSLRDLADKTLEYQDSKDLIKKMEAEL